MREERRRGDALGRDGATRRTDTRLEQAWTLRHREPERSVRIATELRREAEAAGDDAGAARADIVLAANRHRTADLTAMIELAGAAVLVLAPERDIWLARGHLALANATAGAQELARADQLFDRTMELAWNLDDIELVAVALHDQAVLIDDDVAAVDGLRRAERLFRRTLDADAQCFAAANIAQRLLRGGDATAARRAAKRAARVARLTGLVQLEHHSRVIEAHACLAVGDTERARLLTHGIMARSEEVPADARPRLGVAVTELLCLVGEAAPALEWGRTVLADGPPPSLRVPLLTALADAADRCGDARTAYDYLGLATDEAAAVDEARITALAGARNRLREAERRAGRGARDRVPRPTDRAAPDRELSRADPVTGLRPRSALLADLDRLTRSATPPLPVTVVLVEIDGLGDLVQRFGHDTGDDVLALVSHVLRAAIRADDAGYRYGAAEIALLVPGLAAEHALDHGERLLEAASTACARAGAPVELSAGSATTTTRAGIPGLLTRAEVALYQVTCAGEGE